MAFTTITAPNGKQEEFWIPDFATPRELDEQQTRFIESRQSLLATVFGWMIIIITAASCFSAGSVHQPMTSEREAYNERIIGKLNQGSTLPEMRPARPSVTEVDKFYNSKVNAVWQRAIAKGDNFFTEDYFKSLEEIVQLCKDNRMPLYDGVARIGGWNNSFNQAWALQLANGFRNQSDQDRLLDQLSQEYQDLEGTYQSWCQTGVVAVPTHPDFYLRLTQEFSSWMVVSYLKGMAACLLIFLLRLRFDYYFDLREELRFGTKRFVLMVLAWPIGLWAYPRHTKTALYARKLRLKAEFLRDKPLGYELSVAEEKRLEGLALRSGVSLRGLVKQIALSQNRRRRKALATVYTMMLFSMTVTCLARASVLVQPIVLMETVASGLQAADHLPDGRDGPQSPTRTKVAVENLWALLRGNVECTLPRIVGFVAPESNNAGPPGIARKIDHIPLPPLLFRVVLT